MYPVPGHHVPAVLRRRHHKPPRPTRRSAELGNAVTRLGLQFHPEDHLHLDRLPFTFLMGGEARQVANVAWGTVDGMSVWVFDTWLHTRRLPGTGPNLTCVATVITAGFPGLAVIGTGAVPGAGPALESAGYEPVEVSGPLAERFDVYTVDRTFATDLLQPELAAWLAEGDAHDRYETHGPYLVMAVPAVPGDDLGGLLDHLKDFRAHIPPGLVGRYPPGAATGGARNRPTR